MANLLDRHSRFLAQPLQEVSSGRVVIGSAKPFFGLYQCFSAACAEPWVEEKFHRLLIFVKRFELSGRRSGLVNVSKM